MSCQTKLKDLYFFKYGIKQIILYIKEKFLEETCNI